MMVPEGNESADVLGADGAAASNTEQALGSFSQRINCESEEMEELRKTVDGLQDRVQNLQECDSKAPVCGAIKSSSADGLSQAVEPPEKERINKEETSMVRVGEKVSPFAMDSSQQVGIVKAEDVQTESSTASVPVLPAPPASASSLTRSAPQESEKRAAAERQEIGVATASVLSSARAAGAFASGTARSLSMTGLDRTLGGPASPTRSAPALLSGASDESEQGPLLDAGPRKVSVETAASLTPPQTTSAESTKLRAPSSTFVGTPNSLEPLLRDNTDKQLEDLEEPPPPPGSPPGRLFRPPTSIIFKNDDSTGNLGVYEWISNSSQNINIECNHVNIA